MSDVETVVPEGWRKEIIEDVFDFIKTYSNSRSHLTEHDDISYIHYGDIHTKYKFKIDTVNCALPKISRDRFGGKTITFAKHGDLVIADASEDYLDIGKSAEIISNGTDIVSGLHTFLLRDKSSNFAHGYKGYLLYHPKTTQEIRKIATGISVLGISKGNFSKISVYIPPLPEQQRIATILNTWDEAITKQANLIALKEQRKRGLMQQLLTGAVRFPGFDGEWEEKKISSIGVLKSGYGFPQVEQGGSKGIPFFKVSDMNIRENSSVMKLANHYVTNEQIKRLKYKPIIEPSIIFAKVGAAILLDRKRQANNFLLDNNMMAFSPDLESMNFEFIYQKFLHLKLARYAQNGSLPSYNSSDIGAVKLSFPPLAEQQKIAQVLSLADQEIDQLNKQLEALKEQKRGLMQKLLTGQVRVNVA